MTATNDADGKVTFVLTYKDLDHDHSAAAPTTYTYTVSEVKGNAEGVTYDESTYTFAVNVQDNGTGIVRERLPHLFDGIGFLPEKNGVGGRSQMGIGLSVCMSIVKAHGGSMSARNTDGGTAVSFSLPVPPESETAAE